MKIGFVQIGWAWWALSLTCSMSPAAHAQDQPTDEERPRSAPAEEIEPTVAENTTDPIARGFASRGLGLRGAASHLRAAEGEPQGFSGGGDIYERGVGVYRLDFWSGRYFDELWIGYGSEGLRYQLAGQLGFGAIWLFDETQGIVARFALRGHLRREGRVFSSEVRLPGGELGYSFSRGDRQVEVIGHFGTTLAGRFNPEGQTRDLRGITYGSSLSLAWARLRLDADVSQIAASDTAGGVLHARAHLCRLSKDRPGGQGRKSQRVGAPPAPPAWTMCVDFRSMQGHTDLASGESSRELVWGISFMLGELLHL